MQIEGSARSSLPQYLCTLKGENNKSGAPSSTGVLLNARLPMRKYFDADRRSYIIFSTLDCERRVRRKNNGPDVEWLIDGPARFSIYLLAHFPADTLQSRAVSWRMSWRTVVSSGCLLSHLLADTLFRNSTEWRLEELNMDYVRCSNLHVECLRDNVINNL